ncbi:transmembrane protein 70, mitochondrial [Synchiropus picturatus]
MMSANILRGLRACAVSQSFRRSLLTVPGYEACFSGCRLRQFPGGPLLDLNLKVMSQHPPSSFIVPPHRFLCTSTHPKEGNLIYKGTLGKAIRAVKLFSYSSSGFSLVVLPQVILKTGFGTGTMALEVVLCSFVGFLTFCAPILLHLMTKGYVLRLYHCPETDTYTAVTISLFLTELRTVFHQKQVQIPGVSRMFTTFYADKMGLLVSPDFFNTPQDYNHLMGYDKPFSFSSDDLEQPKR